jgi:lipoprotein-anchoring transpeptidase ErfK/SrfK
VRKTGTQANGRGAIVSALIGTMALLAAGCSGPAHAVGVKPSQKPPSAAIAVIPADGAKDVRPDNPVSVTATRGTLRSVTVKARGDSVAGTYSAHGSQWQSSWNLAPATSYTVTAVATGKTGKPVTVTSSFRTLTPQNTFTTQIFEAQGGTYGVGMPIILNFSQPITNKWAVEHSLDLKTSTPVTGAWYWDGDQQADFRPKDYWPAGTQVSLDAHLTGVQGAPGMYATDDLTQSFKIGDSLISYVSPNSHRAQIYKNGHRIGNWPISTGKPGDDTPNGNFLTIDKGNPVDMKPAGISPGQPGYYNLQVAWSVRFTWSGDYMHAAPWSVGQQGSSNVSHGCVNLAPSAAETYYKMEVPGDPVVVSGSPVQGKWDDGWTQWFLSWNQLLNGSATGEAVEAGPNGSQFVSPDSLNSPSPAPPASPSAHASPPAHASSKGA